MRTVHVLVLVASGCVACSSSTGPSGDPPTNDAPPSVPSGPTQPGPPPPAPLTIRVSGRVSNAATGAFLSGARVSIRPNVFPPVSEISSALSDANGRYSLELTVFGACNEDLYEMSAGRDGFRTVRYTRSRGEPFLRCQAGVQTIDFSLERLP